MVLQLIVEHGKSDTSIILIVILFRISNIEQQQLQRNIEQHSSQCYPRQISPEKTTIISPNVTDYPSKSSILKSTTNGTRETTNLSKSLSNRSTSIAEKTTAVVQTSLNQTTFIPQQQQQKPSSEDLPKKLTTTTTVPPKISLPQVTPEVQSRTTIHLKDFPQQSTLTGVISQTTIPLPPTTTINITPSVVQNRSNLSKSSNARGTNAQSHSIIQDSKLESNPLKISSTVSKESTTTTHSHHENHPFVSISFLHHSLNDFFSFLFN